MPRYLEQVCLGRARFDAHATVANDWSEVWKSTLAKAPHDAAAHPYLEVTFRVNTTPAMDLAREHEPRLQMWCSGVTAAPRTTLLSWNKQGKRHTSHWARMMLPMSSDGSWLMPADLGVHMELMVRSPAEDGQSRMYVPAGNIMLQPLNGSLDDAAKPDEAALLRDLRRGTVVQMNDHPLSLLGLADQLMQPNKMPPKATLDAFIRIVAMNPMRDMATAYTVADYSKQPEPDLKRHTDAFSPEHAAAAAQRVRVDAVDQYQLINSNFTRTATLLAEAFSVRVFPYQPYTQTIQAQSGGGAQAEPKLYPGLSPWKSTQPELDSFHLTMISGPATLLTAPFWWAARPHEVHHSVDWLAEERRFEQLAHVTLSQLDLTEKEVIRAVHEWEDNVSEEERIDAMHAVITRVPHGQRTAAQERTLEKLDAYIDAAEVLHSTTVLTATSFPYMGDGTYMPVAHRTAHHLDRMPTTLPSALGKCYTNHKHLHHHRNRRLAADPERRQEEEDPEKMYIYKHVSTEYFCGDQYRFAGAADCEDSAFTAYRDAGRLRYGNPMLASANRHHRRHGGWNSGLLDALQRISHHYCRFGVVGSVTARYLGENDSKEKQQAERQQAALHPTAAEIKELRGDQPVLVGSEKDVKQAEIGGHSWTIHLPFRRVSDSLLDSNGVTTALPDAVRSEAAHPLWEQLLPSALAEGTSCMEVFIEPHDQRYYSTKRHQQLMQHRIRRAHTMLHVSKRLNALFEKRVKDGVLFKRFAQAEEEEGEEEGGDGGKPKPQPKPEPKTALGTLWKRRIQSRASDSPMARLTSFYRMISSIYTEEFFREGVNMIELVPAYVDAPGATATRPGTCGVDLRRLLQRPFTAIAAKDQEQQGRVALVPPPGITDEEIQVNYQNMKQMPQPIYPVLDATHHSQVTAKLQPLVDAFMADVRTALPGANTTEWPARTAEEWRTGDMLHYYASFVNNTFESRPEMHKLLVEELAAIDGAEHVVRHVRIEVEPMFSPNSGLPEGLTNVTVHMTLQHAEFEPEVAKEFASLLSP